MKSLCISVVIHFLLISFVWVGFSVSKGSEQKAFTYLGEVAEVESVRGHSYGSDSAAFSDLNAYQGLKADPARSWLKMRELDKPR